MKNQKLLTIAALAGLTLGGLSATAASAQSYGDESTTSVEQTESTIDTSSGDADGIVLVQDTEVPDSTDTDGQAPEGERSGRRGHRGGCNLDDAAEAIGIDEADLQAAIESGDSIADVAAANGVDADVVIDAMVNAKAEHIAEKVTEGRITQDEADVKLAELEARVTDQVNGVEEAPQS